MAMENTFINYYNKIEKTYLTDELIYKIQEEQIQKDFESFGLTEMEKAQILMQFRAQIVLGIEKQATDSTLALMKLEQDKLLQNAKINTEIAQQGLINAQRATELKQPSLLTARTELTNAQKTIEEKKGIKILADACVSKANSAKIIRDKRGYDDQILLKIIEHQAKLASFAVNVGSDEATLPIANLLTSINSAKARIGMTNESISCPS